MNKAWDVLRQLHSAKLILQQLREEIPVQLGLQLVTKV